MADIGTICLGFIGLFILYLFCRLFIKPIRWILRLLFSCILGAAVIFSVQFLVQRWGMTLSLNPLTAMIVGVLGLPGVVLTLLLSAIL